MKHVMNMSPARSTSPGLRQRIIALMSISCLLATSSLIAEVGPENKVYNQVEKARFLKAQIESGSITPTERAPRHPLFVPRSEAAGGDDRRPAKVKGASKKGYVPPAQKWPEGAGKESIDHIIRTWNEQAGGEELQKGIQAAMQAPTEKEVEPSAPEKSRMPWSREDSEAVTKAATGEKWKSLFFGVETKTGRHYSGRATQVSRAYDPAQGMSTLWLGTVGGGLYKGVFLGLFAAWMPVSWTLEGSPSVGSFAVRPSNGSEILIGTGDMWRFRGDGLYKTVDGGGSWTRTLSFSEPPGFPNAVNRIRVDWSNDAVVLAATTVGIFYSGDFGDSWTQITIENATDVIQDPDNPEHWYAGVPNKGIMFSEDGGFSFGAKEGCAGIPGNIGRTELAISPSAANFVYAVVADGRVLNGIYRSNDYGCRWTSIESVDTNSYGIASVAMAIAVDPTTPDRLFVGMGGAQYTEQATAAAPCWYRNGSGASDCGLPGGIDAGHPDMTDMVFDGDNLLITNDGGIFTFDWTTQKVEDLGNDLGLSTLQTTATFQMMTVSNPDPDLVFAGLQDNGVARNRPGTTAKMLVGGDGGTVSASPDDVSQVYFSSTAPFSRKGSWTGGATTFGLQCGLTTDGFAGSYCDPTPGRAAEEAFLFTVSPDPESDEDGSFVWYKPQDTAACDWQKAHEEPLPLSVLGFDQNNDPSDWGLYVYGGRDRRVMVLEDGRPGSMVWEDRTPPGIDLPITGSGADVRVFADRSGVLPRTAYYTTATAQPSRAFVTHSRGLAWHEVTGNLPSLIGGLGIFEMIGDPRDVNTLIAATEVGVFRTDDALGPSPSWYRYMSGLPAVTYASNLEVNVLEDGSAVLRLGTYGHGLWERLIEPVDPED